MTTEAKVNVKKANTSICTSIHKWRGKAACLVYSQHTCHSSVEICNSHNMKLFTIHDDFDAMLILYFTNKQFHNDSGEFWIHIYDYSHCIALVSNDGSLSLQFYDFENDVRKYFFCEFKER
ncbi:hypothetical protein PVAND_015329 [Polypedilum vanderplanki]|uniref:Uncharacterized protein n=1 Tax=Polypedilum vanderplanki TaxID=319348 RepID=A0A9J6BCB3_POLVA|nr:hypothetical protein PVAND_015329 [Polypedilum vanderplanki]